MTLGISNSNSKKKLKALKPLTPENWARMTNITEKEVGRARLQKIISVGALWRQAVETDQKCVKAAEVRKLFGLGKGIHLKAKYPSAEKPRS